MKDQIREEAVIFHVALSCRDLRRTVIRFRVPAPCFVIGLIVTCLLCCSVGSHALAAKTWSEKSFAKFVKKNQRVADQMGRPRVGAYLRLALPMGYYSQSFSSEKNSIEVEGAPGAAIFLQPGLNLWSNFGVHLTYAYSLLRDRDATLSINGQENKGETSLSGHSIGAGFMWRPFYRPFLIERLKRYNSIVGHHPYPSGAATFFNAFYIAADGFLVKRALGFGRTRTSDVVFTTDWGWGRSIAIGYESSMAHPATFDIGLQIMYTRNGSQDIVTKDGNRALPGIWGNLFIGIRFMMAVYFPERAMIRGLF